jgi:hypothetical protein
LRKESCQWGCLGRQKNMFASFTWGQAGSAKWKCWHNPKWRQWTPTLRDIVRSTWVGGWRCVISWWAAEPPRINDSPLSKMCQTPYRAKNRSKRRRRQELGIDEDGTCGKGAWNEGYGIRLKFQGVAPTQTKWGGPFHA